MSREAQRVINDMRHFANRLRACIQNHLAGITSADGVREEVNRLDNGSEIMGDNVTTGVTKEEFMAFMEVCEDFEQFMDDGRQSAMRDILP